MWNQTTVSKQLHLRYPIIQAPMAGGCTTPELVAAVSNAGGLGSLGAGYMTPDDLRESIRKIRVLTSKPFSVNLFIPEKHYATHDDIKKMCRTIEALCPELGMQILPEFEKFSPCFEEQIDVLLNENVPIFSFTFGLLKSKYIRAFKENKTLLIGSATTLHEANILQDSGIDMIVAQGKEAGGHLCR